MYYRKDEKTHMYITINICTHSIQVDLKNTTILNTKGITEDSLLLLLCSHECVLYFSSIFFFCTTPPSSSAFQLFTFAKSPPIHPSPHYLHATTHFLITFRKFQHVFEQNNTGVILIQSYWNVVSKFTFFGGVTWPTDILYHGVGIGLFQQIILGQNISFKIRVRTESAVHVWF